MYRKKKTGHRIKKKTTLKISKIKKMMKKITPININKMKICNKKGIYNLMKSNKLMNK